MSDFPSRYRALRLVGRALLLTVRAVNWCFLSILPDNHV